MIDQALNRCLIDHGVRSLLGGWCLLSCGLGSVVQYFAVRVGLYTETHWQQEGLFFNIVCTGKKPMLRCRLVRCLL